MALGGFEDDGRPDDVHARALYRVRAHEGDLQGRQVDDVRNAVIRDGALEACVVGDVAFDELDFG